MQLLEWLSSKPCQFIKKYFFSIKLLHAHLQHVCNISAKCWKDPMEALRGDDFTKYALSITIYYGQLSENGYVKNPVSLSKKYFFSIKHHAHHQYVWNISAKCWKNPMKALRWVDFTKDALSTMCSCRKMAKLKAVSVCQNIFFQHQTSTCTSSICL